MSNPETVSRRKFMGSAALAGAAVSFPNVLTAESKGKEVIRFALIGCGGRGKGAAAQGQAAAERRCAGRRCR